MTWATGVTQSLPDRVLTSGTPEAQSLKLSSGFLYRSFSYLSCLVILFLLRLSRCDFKLVLFSIFGFAIVIVKCVCCS